MRWGAERTFEAGARDLERVATRDHGVVGIEDLVDDPRRRGNAVEVDPATDRMVLGQFDEHPNGRSSGADSRAIHIDELEMGVGQGGFEEREHGRGGSRHWAVLLSRRMRLSVG